MVDLTSISDAVVLIAAIVLEIVVATLMALLATSVQPRDVDILGVTFKLLATVLKAPFTVEAVTDATSPHAVEIIHCPLTLIAAKIERFELIVLILPKTLVIETAEAKLDADVLIPASFLEIVVATERFEPDVIDLP